MNFSYYLLNLSYKGTNYLGWQTQGQKGPTIQGKLNLALEEISHSSEIHTVGAGRTDAGVHALEQVCRAKIPLVIDPENLKKGLNSLLPKDIRVLECGPSSENFNPTSDAKSKEYLYYFTAGDKNKNTPQSGDLMAHYPFEVDLGKMREGLELFIGEKNFCNFYCQGTGVKSTIRQIFELEMVSMAGPGHLPFWPAEYYILRVRGNGFLKQMVRLMVGAIWNLGRGKITLADIERAINNPAPQRVGAVAPPQGLYLSKIFY
jgi:tRNA pseudouridine38-40 synthase